MLRRPPKRKNAENDVSSQRVREGRERELRNDIGHNRKLLDTNRERPLCEGRDDPLTSESIYEAETKLFIEHCS